MRLRKQYKILGMLWRLRQNAKTDKVLDAGNWFGLSVFETKEIYIHTDLEEDREFDTLMHEISEVIYEQSGLQEVKALNPYLHQIIQLNGTALSQVLRENKMLMTADIDDKLRRLRAENYRLKQKLALIERRKKK